MTREGKRMVENGSGCLTTLLVSLLIDAAAIYGIVWLVRSLGRMLGWWQ